MPQETEGHPAEEPGVHGGVRAGLGGSPDRGSREHELRRREVPCLHKAVLTVTSLPLSIPPTSGDTIYVITYVDD